MSEMKIKNALISVFHKDNIDPLVKKLNDLGVNIYSTGGTERHIEALGIKVNKVEDLTGYPSILGGRVKTLPPKVFGGILSRSDNDSDGKELAEYEIPVFDLVIVDLYPFEQTVDEGKDHQSIIEKIDIGGITLIRAAAKNYKDCLVVPSQKEFTSLLETLNKNDGTVTIDERKTMAMKAFKISSHYDSSIFRYFNAELEEDRKESALRLSINDNKPLRYGENPHQSSVFFGDIDSLFDQLHGKDLSYNNILDIDAAVNTISEFDDITFAILKHNNACGLASRATVSEAYAAALAGDPVSAFGGILITNTEVDKAASELINDLFFEVIIAPSYAEDALEILKSKKNRRILIQKPTAMPDKIYRTALNGILEQDRDAKMESQADMKVVTTASPSDSEYEDLIFANKSAKHLKSNTISLCKGKQLFGMGCGQTSRVDALRYAIEKAKHFNFDLNGAVMASDAFFPFPDCVEIAHKAGITAVIQPGGSIKDQLSIDYCNENGMSMVTTGTRHFRH